MDLDGKILENDKENETYEFVENMKNTNTKIKTKSDIKRVMNGFRVSVLNYCYKNYTISKLILKVIHTHICNKKVITRRCCAFRSYWRNRIDIGPRAEGQYWRCCANMT